MLPERPEWAAAALYLSEDEIRYPLSVIQGFFEDHSLGEIRGELLNQMVACLTTPNPNYATPLQRENLIETYRRMIRLLEAVYTLMQ